MLGAMSVFDAPPEDGLDALWDDPDTAGTEACSLRWENAAWTLEIRSGPLDCHLVVRIGPTWQVRQVLVFRDLEDPDLWLATDGASRWGEVNGAHREDLDGCFAVGVHDSIAILMPVVRSLPLEPGHAAEIKVAVIDTESLSVTPHRWRILRVEHQEFVVEDLTSGSTLTVATDVYGLPLDTASRRRVV